MSNVHISVLLTESDLGVGTVSSSVIFNICMIVGVCALVVYAIGEITFDWRPLARDCTFYVSSLGFWLLVVRLISPGQINWYESLVMLLFYVVYILFIVFFIDCYMEATNSLGRKLMEMLQLQEGRSKARQKPLTSQIHKHRLIASQTLSQGIQRS